MGLFAKDSQFDIGADVVLADQSSELFFVLRSRGREFFAIYCGDEIARLQSGPLGSGVRVNLGDVESFELRFAQLFGDFTADDVGFDGQPGLGDLQTGIAQLLNADFDHAEVAA